MSEKESLQKKIAIQKRQEFLNHRLLHYQRRGINVHQFYEKPPVSAETHNNEQINQLFDGCAKGCDISKFKDPIYSAEQMRIFVKMETFDFDIDRILNPNIEPTVMNEYFFACRNQIKIPDEVDLTACTASELHQMWCNETLPEKLTKVGQGREQSTSHFETFREAIEGKDVSFQTNIYGWGLYDSTNVVVKGTLEWNKDISADRMEVYKPILEKCGFLPSAFGKTMKGYELYNLLNKFTKNDSTTGKVLYELGYSGIDYEVGDGNSKRVVIFNEKDQALVDNQLKRLNGAMLNKVDKVSLIKELQDLMLKSDGTIKVNFISSNSKVGSAVLSKYEETNGDAVTIVKDNNLFVNLSKVNHIDDIRDIWLQNVAAKEGINTLVPNVEERNALLSDIWNNAVRLSEDSKNGTIKKIVTDIKEKHKDNEVLENKEELGLELLGNLAKTQQVKDQLTPKEGNFVRRTCNMVRNAVKKCFGKDITKCQTETDLLNIASTCARVSLEKGIEITLAMTRTQKEVMKNGKAHFLTKQEDVTQQQNRKKGLGV